MLVQGTGSGVPQSPLEFEDSHATDFAPQSLPVLNLRVDGEPPGCQFAPPKNQARNR
jgi:hypothetical protein